ERESKLYDEFDTFTSVPGEISHANYLRFAKLINGMYSIGMTMKPIKFNTKIVNHLQPEWIKFMTDVKLAKYLYNANFDHLYGYLRQHEAHANKVCQSRQQYPDSITLEEMAFLADNKDTVTTGQQSQEILTLVAFQTNNLDAFDPKYDEAPSVSVVLMAKLSSYDFDVLSKVPIHDNYLDNHVNDEIVQEMQYSEQPYFNNETDVGITKALKLAETSRLKMHAEQNDPIVKEKKVNIAPIAYVALNKLFEHFVKNFMPQNQLFAEQAFWLPISQPVSEKPPIQPEPVLKEIPCELPKISLVKDSFNKMRSHVNVFDNVITVCTKVTGQNEGAWGI
nr:hypothetical protein [Tanacetum cinerariifolium]